MFRKVSLLLALVSSLLLIETKSTFAQEITVDGSTATIVTKEGNRITIDGNTLSKDGKNLFHSFQELGLSNEQIATFLTNPNIQNILTRITGGNPSHINGLIEVVGGNSNLFIMNPAGIIFGNNASLNVPADFTATTSTGIGFENGIFNAVGSNDYQNLTGNPTSFIFNSQQAGGIINSGYLTLTEGKNITLIGGNVINTGTIETPNGKIFIEAVSGTSTIKITPEHSLLSLEVDLDVDERGNLVGFTPQDLPELLTGANRSGVKTEGITVNENKVEVAGVEIPKQKGISAIAGKISTNSNLDRGGEVTITGEKVAVIDGQISADGATGGGKVLIGGDYKGAGTITNSSITLVNKNSQITANAIDNGDGGKVVVWSDGNTTFRGSIEAKGGMSNGNGGIVEVSGKENLLFTGRVDTTALNGEKGLLLLDPRDVIIVDGSDAIDDLQIEDGTIFVEDGLITDYTISETALENLSGTTDVLIEARRDIIIQNLSDNQLTFQPNVVSNESTTSISFIANTDGGNIGSFSMDSSDAIVARGRDVNIFGVNLTIGAIDTSTPSGSLSGNAGDITLNADNNIFVSGTITDTTGNNYSLLTAVPLGSSGNGGNVEIISNDGDISVGTIGTFSNNIQGDVNLRAPNNLTVGSIITFLNTENSSQSLTGGTITLVGENITFDGEEITGQSLTTFGDLTIDFNSDNNANITTIDNQLYQGITTANRDTVFTSNLGSLRFTDEIDSLGSIDLIANQEVDTLNITANDRVRIISSQSVKTANITTNGSSINISSANFVPIDIDTRVLNTQGGSITLNAGEGRIINDGINAFNGSILLVGNEIDLNGGDNSVSGASISFLTGNSTQSIRIGGIEETGDLNLDLTIRDLNALEDGFSRILVASGNGSSGLNEPLDIFFLQDLSGSFSEDLVTIRNLSQDLVETIQALQPDTQFGVGTFSGTNTPQLAFDLKLPLTDNNQAFIDTLNSLSIDSGADETQLFALQQSAVRGEEIGLRNGALHYSILFTDEDYFQPRTFNPSVSEVRQDLIDAGVEPIFAVTSNQIDTYQDLANQLGTGQVVQLSSDSSNLIEAIVVGIETSNPGMGQITIVDNGSPLNIKDSFSAITGGELVLENTTLNVDGSINLQGNNLVNTSAGIINTTSESSGINISSNQIVPSEINSQLGGINLNGDINLQTPSVLNTPGDIVLRGNLTGAQDLTLNSGATVTTQNLDTSGLVGGNITINALSDVVVSSIDTSSSEGVGGNVAVTTFGNFRVTDVIGETDRSIDATGSNGGGNILIDLFPEGSNIDLLEDFRLPFVVGSTEASSGTAGIITNTGSSIDRDSYLSTQNVNNITINLLDIEEEELNLDLIGISQIFFASEDVGFVSAISNNSELGLILTTSQAKQVLAEIEAQSAEKPALIYVSFTPRGYQPESLEAEFARREKNNTQDYSQIGINKKGLNPTVDLPAQEEDILDLLIITAKGEPVRITVPVTRQEVVENAGRLWGSLSDVFALDDTYKSYASNLYSWLIKPLEAELEKQEISNLLFILPTEIRFTPIAALYDDTEKMFLVEKYSSGLAPSLNLNNNNYRPIKDLSLLAMGASDFADPSVQPLPAAGLELPTIRQVWNQKTLDNPQSYVNDNFTLDQIQAKLSANPYGIVHFGTHGEFNPGEIDESYIQLYNSRLGIDEIRQLGLNNPLVELMVLSACETAFGDEIAELGFAGLAVQAGVKTAMGSVWQVSDTGTLALMTDFYNQLKTRSTKTEALRQAQLNLLQKNVYKTENGKTIVTPETEVSLERLPEEARLPEDFSHPFYWAPFTVIGNPW